MHLKLDELIRAAYSERDALMDLENFSDEEVAHLEEEFKKLRARASQARPPES